MWYSQRRPRPPALRLLLALPIAALLLHTDAPCASAKQTEIIKATGEGNIAVVKELLKKGSSGKTLKSTDEKGMTALMWASLEGNENLVTLLLRKNWYTRCFSRSNYIEMVNNDGWSALMLASKMNHPNIVRILLGHLAHPNHLFQRSQKSAMSALSTACSKGHMEVVKLLLLSNSNLEHVRLPNKMGSTPLMLASYQGHTDIVQELLNVDPNGFRERDQDGCIALMYACSAGRLRVAARLLQKEVFGPFDGQMQVRDNQGRSALMFASMNGFSQIVELLLSKGGNEQAKYSSWSQETALYHACANGHFFIAKLLLEALDSDSGWAIQLQDDLGCTPLFVASAKGHLRIVELLLEKLGSHSADTIRLQNDDDRTALIAASANGHVDIVRRLVAADPSADNLFIDDSEGRTALEVALMNNHKDVEHVLTEEWSFGQFNP